MKAKKIIRKPRMSRAQREELRKWEEEDAKIDIAYEQYLLEDQANQDKD